MQTIYRKPESTSRPPLSSTGVELLGDSGGFRESSTPSNQSNEGLLAPLGYRAPKQPCSLGSSIETSGDTVSIALIRRLITFEALLLVFEGRGWPCIHKPMLQNGY